MKNVLTTTEVARLLGMHANTLKNWVRSGKIPSYKTLGGHYRIRSSELVESLKRNGIPVPADLRDVEKDVFVVHPDKSVRDAIERDLERNMEFKVTSFDNGIEPLLVMNDFSPRAVLWCRDCKDVNVDTLAQILKDENLSGQVELILFNNGKYESGVDGSNAEVYDYPSNFGEIVERIKSITN